MPPSRPRGRGDPSTDPIAYVTAAAVIRDEAATWDAKPWNRFGQGPVHMHRQANGPETWRKLAWSRMVAWNTRLFHKEETPENILSQMRQVAETWERQASLHPPPDLSPDEVRRLEAIEARTPLTPAAPIANAFARLEANLLPRAPEGLFVYRDWISASDALRPPRFDRHRPLRPRKHGSQKWRESAAKGYGMQSWNALLESTMPSPPPVSHRTGPERADSTSSRSTPTRSSSHATPSNSMDWRSA